MSNSIRNFALGWKRNGAYLTISYYLERMYLRYRNRRYASRLGVKAFSVGRGEYIPNLAALRVGENFQAGRGLWIEAITEFSGKEYSPLIEIGKNFTCSANFHLGAVNHVKIGDNVLIGSKVLITDHTHGGYSGDIHSDPGVPPFERELSSRGGVAVGNNVFIGDGVVIMPGVSVGDGAVIGSNAVVTRSIPGHTIAFGAPAIPIKRYDFDHKVWMPIKGTRI